MHTQGKQISSNISVKHFQKNATQAAENNCKKCLNSLKTGKD